VRLNAAELEATAGRLEAGSPGMVAGATRLVAAGAEWVAVTRGAAPAWLLGRGVCREHRLPRVTPVNPVGCGDAMLSGVAAALARGCAMTEAVAYGLACGCAKALEPNSRGFDPRRAEEFLRQIEIVSH